MILHVWDLYKFQYDLSPLVILDSISEYSQPKGREQTPKFRVERAYFCSVFNDVLLSLSNIGTPLKLNMETQNHQILNQLPFPNHHVQYLSVLNIYFSVSITSIYCMILHGSWSKHRSTEACKIFDIHGGFG